MARDGVLPRFLGCLHPRFRVPWNAQHLVIIVTLVIAPIWGHYIGPYLSYEWWGASLVFFAMLSNIVVNIGCTVFFYRFRRGKFSWWAHGTLPTLGTLTSLLPLYYCFGPDLWNSGWKMGQSISCDHGRRNSRISPLRTGGREKVSRTGVPLVSRRAWHCTFRSFPHFGGLSCSLVCRQSVFLLASTCL